jgi:ArsR family transcriptional regulator
MKSNEEHSKEFQQLALWSKSIGHPTRLSILRALADRGGWVEGEIIPVQGVSPSTIIQHLRELKRAGIIQGRIFGAQCKYGLNMEILQEFNKVWSSNMTHIIKASTNA